MAPRAFTLIETMLALALAGIVSVALAGLLELGVQQSGTARHEWVAFTLAQSRMELLDAAPTSSTLLNQTTGLADPGSATDLSTCEIGDSALNPTTFRVDAYSGVTADGLYELCWKVEDGFPSGSLKYVRVVATYPSPLGRKSVSLQTYRY